MKESALPNYLNKLYEQSSSTLNSTTITNSHLNLSLLSNDYSMKGGSEIVHKIFNFIIFVLNDVNHLIEKLSKRDYTYLSDYFISVNSMKFYCPSQLNDDRFLDDLIDLN
jgi:hypothetical protein